MEHSGQVRTAGYTLVHNQRFDSDAAIEPLRKQYIWPLDVIINDEEQMYDERAVSIVTEDGVKVLALRMSEVGDELEDAGNTNGTFNGQPRTQELYSGLVTSERFFSVGPFFKIEFRAKLPEGAGLWSALWLLAFNGRWPEGQPMLDEVDVGEFLGKWPNGKVHTAVHKFKGKDEKWEKTFEHDGLDAYGSFNNYTAEFTPHGIFFGVNGEMFARAPMPPEWLNHVWHYNLNLAGGGKWAGKVDRAILPATMFVEHVKIWQTAEHLTAEPIDDKPIRGQGTPSGSPRTDRDDFDPDEQVEQDPPDDEVEGEEPPAPGSDSSGPLRDGGFEFTVDPDTKTLAWVEQENAVKYAVYRNGRYMTQVRSASYRALQPGRYSVQGVTRENYFLARSPEVTVTAAGRHA